jgi:biopolymer transport protein TolQ
MSPDILALFQRVATQSSPVIQTVLLLLAAMSVASWGLILYKFFTIRAARRCCERELSAFLTGCTMSEGIEALERISRHKACARMADRGQRELELCSRGLALDRDVEPVMENVQVVLDDAASRELSRHMRGLTFLGTCANAGPFLGLFGTVWGIMRAFQAIGAMQAASLDVVGPGIAEALTTTAVGLAVAIPAALAYNYFLDQLMKLKSDLTAFSSAYRVRLRRDLRAGAIAPAPLSSGGEE